MDKLIEMTIDGRLAMAWTATAVLLAGVIFDLVITLRNRKRRVSGAKRSGKSQN